MENRALIRIAVFLFLLSGFLLSGCKLGPECKLDSDCVKVQLTCCPCSMGGKEGCINKNLAPLYEEKLKSCPQKSELVCIAQDNCKIKECVCLEGRCMAKETLG